MTKSRKKDIWQRKTKEGCDIMPINENTLEQAVIAQLQENGYEYLYGPDIDRDYHEVILRDYFEAACLSWKI